MSEEARIVKELVDSMNSFLVSCHKEADHQTLLAKKQARANEKKGGKSWLAGRRQERRLGTAGREARAADTATEAAFWLAHSLHPTDPILGSQVLNTGAGYAYEVACDAILSGAKLDR